MMKIKKNKISDRISGHWVESKALSGGYSILELLFYIALLSILSIVVINAMITMMKSFKETTLQAQFTQSGAIMERISREIKQAYDINTITGNSLKLNTKDVLGNNKTIEFLFTNGNMQLLENNILIGNLNTPNILINNANFTQINTAKSKAVKVSLTVELNGGSSNGSQNFYDTVVLRGSY